MALVYHRSGLVLKRGSGGADPELVKALQRDLRKLGYLKVGIDGQFGEGTEAALRALQFDLLHAPAVGAKNPAPVSLRDFNGERVTSVTGVLDENLAACLEDILEDARVPTLPRSDDPAAANRAAFAAVQGLVGLPVPRPFLIAILLQESSGLHFRVPSGANADDFIVVGLDRNEKGNTDHITSRGYGMGQYTLFHHPPTAEEVTTLMLDPVRNVERAVRELKDKFDGYVNGPTPGEQADDRLDEIGDGALRRCRFEPTDSRFMTDCATCAGEVLMNIKAGSRLHPHTTETLQPTQYHAERSYDDVPDRAKLRCDWPYAVRRYNGSGVNSYHYQYQILQRLTRPPVTD
jgi:hypothetical protein